MAKDDNLKSQLGGFVRAALAQLETVREVVVQKSKAGKIHLDVAMLKRQRKDVLAELGGVVARLALNGKISEDDYPELGAPLARLEAIDERIDYEAERARRVGLGVDDDHGHTDGDPVDEDGEEVAEELDTDKESG